MIFYGLSINRYDWESNPDIFIEYTALTFHTLLIIAHNPNQSGVEVFHIIYVYSYGFIVTISKDLHQVCQTFRVFTIAL